MMAEKKKHVFKKFCLVLKKGTICTLLVEYSELLTGITLKRYGENSFFVEFIKIRSTNDGAEEIPNLVFHISLIAPVNARQVLYCISSNFL